MSYFKRKKDHIRLALDEKNVLDDNGFSKIRLVHEALPELDWKDIDLSSTVLGKKRKTPFFVSAMTGGFPEAQKINFNIASTCVKKGWMMGVGSQRRQLTHPETAHEWLEIKNKFPDLCIFGNLGLSQLIHTPLEKVEELVNSLGAEAMVVHTNPLQECCQPEGTPNFKGGIKRLGELAKNLSVPLCLKETGCGFSYKTLKSLCGLGLKAVDVSGFGGTHWGRIEGDRSGKKDIRKKVSKTFSHWGNTTLYSLLCARELSEKERDFEIWASGGIKSGLSAAKALALGARAVGFAHVILKKALLGVKDLEEEMNLIEYELKTALFCTGNSNPQELEHWEYS